MHEVQNMKTSFDLHFVSTFPNLCLECMSGQDPRDPTTLKSSSTESIIPSSNISDLSCVTIGIPQV